MWGEIPDDPVPVVKVSSKSNKSKDWDKTSKQDKDSEGTQVHKTQDVQDLIEPVPSATDLVDWQAQKKHLVQAVAGRCKESGLFKSQQRGDPDLTRKEKEDLAEQVLERSPALFLARFGHLLGRTELEWMADKFKDGSEDDYEVNFHLRRLGAEACKVNSNRKVKNRRYVAMTRMISSSDDYFTETGMRRRNPLLYHKMVGKYLSEEERRQRQKDEGEAGGANCSLTNIILEHMDINKERDLKKEQENEEKLEEFDSDDSDGEDDDKDADGGDDVDLESLLAEFRNAMIQSFLDGNDEEHFDYSKVDNDDSLDDLDTVGRDEEDRYFDKEEANEEECNDNGQDMEYDY